VLHLLRVELRSDALLDCLRRGDVELVEERIYFWLQSGDSLCTDMDELGREYRLTSELTGPWSHVESPLRMH
jgi:hypothetical protein